jgi:Ca2+:H+ antiporter
MAGVIVISEILVGSIEVVTAEFGFGELFVGAIIIGIVGNAAEHSQLCRCLVQERVLLQPAAQFRTGIIGLSID